jgi:hypothetical protein
MSIKKQRKYAILFLTIFPLLLRPFGKPFPEGIILSFSLFIFTLLRFPSLYLPWQKAHPILIPMANSFVPFPFSLGMDFLYRLI